MRKLIFATLLLVFAVSFTAVFSNLMHKNQISGAPPYGETETEAPQFGSLEWMNTWKRPDVPVKVALQAGHWKSSDAPDEQKRLRDNTGSSGGGKWEWEVNLAIAHETQKMLQAEGIDVEILPTKIPPSYWADVFLAIHADGSTDRSKRGFKIAGPWRDFTGKSADLTANIYDSYEKATGYAKDDNITRNMRGYYAFSWWRYEHAIHPMTTAAIIETGFLTNLGDQEMLINSPEISARGISDGIIKYLEDQGLIARN